MGKKITGWRTKGMNRDLSVSAFSSEFAFENRNLRLSTLENNTLMSWVNEKGPKELSVEIDTQPWNDNHSAIEYVIEGFPIGTAIVNHKLVLFTTGTYDCIYVFKYNSASKEYYDNNKEGIPDMIGYLIYKGHLNFSTEYPLETLVSYEADHIQKVYWTDGFNQPRLINVALEGNSYKERLSRWNHGGTPSSNVDTFFDFVPTINASSIGVNKYITSGGTFAPGVIQYCYTYINKYGQQSNIADVSSLYYLSHNDRGAGPEDKVGCCFEITIQTPDTNFDYVRLYSIQRTSYNLDPIVKRLEDIPIKGATTIKYRDAGNDGDTMDPTELLFVGGKEISALTMADKDQTLFLGNIEQKRTLVNSIQNYFNEHKVNINFGRKNSYTINNSNSIYHYENQLKNLNQSDITTFKGGENYRFGFQLQKLTGEWTEPIYLNDATNELYPNVVIDNSVPVTTISLVKAYVNKLNIGTAVGDISQYQRIRPVIVFPTISNKKVLCQGVLNPTLFNIFDRVDNSPYAQPSWYFRPYIVGDIDNDSGDQDTVIIDVDSNHVTVSMSALDPSTYNTGASSPTSFIDVYVLLLNMSNDTASNVLRRGTIRIHVIKFAKKENLDLTDNTEQSFGEIYTQVSQVDTYVAFNGAIIIDSDNSDTTVAFFKTTPWAKENDLPLWSPKSAPMNAIVSTYIDERGCFVGCESNSFELYNKLEINDDNLLYLYDPKADDDPQTSAATYTFNFYVSTASIGYDKNYSVLFTSYNNNSSYSYNLNSNDSGTPAEYMHYTPLACQNLLSSYNPSDRKKAKKVEIQGSFSLYTSPFSQQYATAGDLKPGFGGSRAIVDDSNINIPSDISEIKKGRLSTNTEYFIDHSIVTLNSPDIEFDTEVQVFPKESLSLRIIGIIPITSSVSAHSITTSSAMLETNYNEGDKSMTVTFEHGTFGGSGLKDWSFGQGELYINAKHNNFSSNAGSRLIADYLWNDSYLITDPDAEDAIKTEDKFYNYLIFPWHRSGSLNNDWRSIDKASSWLQTKKESNLLFSVGSEYLSSDKFVSFTKMGVDIPLTENAEVMNYRLPKQTPNTEVINYYPNIDKVLYNKNGYYAIRESANMETERDVKTLYSPISIKYKSTSHAVIAFNSINYTVPILPYGIINNKNTPNDLTDDVVIGKYSGNPSDDTTTTYWGDLIRFDQSPIDITNTRSKHFDFLWLGEIYKTPVRSFDGNPSDEDLIANKWIVGGPAIAIANTVNLEWTIGDTYYQRYDCLKTYPFTNEDTNQLAEILSFMCETHVNIDGRYDRNRGQVDNYNMRPENFNKLNPVYSQQDNFFTSRKLDTKDVNELRYPNHLYYSKTKTSGADVDLWTNVTLASTLELDGDKGKLNSLQRFNDQIIAFQDTGISQILYNENVQISSQQGVPIELANSGKVQGARYISDTVGCSNKWSITSAPTGIYFMDSVGKNIYLFNGQLNSLSTSLGFNTWSKQNIPDTKAVWTPDAFENFVAYYDKLNQDILFINKETCLAFSDRLNVFTSFYSYENTPYFCNLDSAGVWVKSDGNGQTLLYKHNAGEYCNFFGVNKPYSLTLVGNIEPQVDKIFTNLEFRTCVDNDKTREENTMPGLPFDNLETWNEYQHGIAYFQADEGRYSNIHHSLNSGNNATLKRKFRVWRCDIPRDNAPISTDSSLPTMVSRMFTHPLDRMRNPWIYLKLQKEAAEEGTFHRRAEIHDIIMTYFS